MINPELYRPNVGMMVVNKGLIFMGKRCNTPHQGWQMPQGGIDLGEKIVDAARRELLEEIGTQNVALIKVYDHWLYYDIPEKLRTPGWFNHYKGQKQKWVLFKFLGQDYEINIQTQDPEFSAWQWTQPQDILDQVVDFKRAIYQQILTQFMPDILSLRL